MGNVQKYLAEALGTFTLVVVGSFAILSSLLFPAAGAGIVSIALGFGLAPWTASTRSRRCRAATTTPPCHSRCSSTAGCRRRTWSATGSRRSRARSPPPSSSSSRTTTTPSRTRRRRRRTSGPRSSSRSCSRQSSSRSSSTRRGPSEHMGRHSSRSRSRSSRSTSPRSRSAALRQPGAEPRAGDRRDGVHDLWIYLIAPPIGEAVLGWLAHRVVVLGTRASAGGRPREGASG